MGVLYAQVREYRAKLANLGCNLAHQMPQGQARAHCRLGVPASNAQTARLDPLGKGTANELLLIGCQLHPLVSKSPLMNYQLRQEPQRRRGVFGCPNHSFSPDFLGERKVQSHRRSHPRS